MNPQGKPDILCFSSTDWEGLWGSRQQVMGRFARRGYRVLFVEQLSGFEHLLRYPGLRQRRYRRLREGLRKIADNLWIVSPPPLLPGRYYSLPINRINSWLTVNWLKRYLAKLSIASPLLWVYKPEHGGLISHFDERLSIYHCIDEWTVGTRGRKRATITRLESDLLTAVNLVFANSPPTYEKKRRFNANTFRLPSGADIEHFAQVMDPALSEHPALAGIPRPRIGYSGTINERLDYSYLEHLAHSHPDWALVLIGDPYPWRLDAPQIQRLKALPNTHFLGQHPFEQMPSLLKGLDVCLIPYVRDERGYYRSPLKLYEYLAAGKPVVSIDHPEARELEASIYLASTPEEFVTQIAEALQQDCPELQDERINVARGNSWDHRVDKMEAILIQTLKIHHG